MTSDDAPSPDEQGSFEVLASYLEHLQQGRASREAWSASHPELSPALECLDALERLAADVASPPTLSDSSRARPPGADGLPPTAAVETGSAPNGAVRTPAGAAAFESGSPHREPASSHPGADRGCTAAPRRPWAVFGDYELLEELGRGGMGVVYRAVQSSLERQVAVKMILASHLAAGEQVERFLAEARAAAAVRHPNIVSVFGAGQCEGQHFFVMEYVEGASLAEQLRQGALDQETALRWLIQIARAVDHLHRHGIVHRDLKPSNILIDRRGHPLVNDFGLAKMLSGEGDLTRSGLIAGTPSYMAPEQARGRAAGLGPAADIYSLGAILYEVLTGRPPFRGATPLDTILEVLERTPKPPRSLNPQVPPELEWIALRCLEKSPERRYPSAAALAEDLERHLRGEPIATPAPGRWQQAWRWIKREPALASHLAVMAGFYLVELANYHVFQVIDRTFHLPVSLILLVWVATLLVCQRFLHQPRWAEWARFAWATIDAGAILALLLWADGAASPLIVALPLAVAGSGLWFRVRLVWYMTALSLVSYAILVFDFYYRREDLRAQFDAAYDRPVYFAMMLVALGFVGAFQVQRIRKLSNFYQRHRVL